MAIIGIDLGTTNSLICVYRNGKPELIPNAFGETMTRSAVSFLEDGTVLVGALAAERLISHPETAAASFKSFMGTEQDYTLNGRKLKAHELSALVLRQLCEDAQAYLGEEVTEAVISVPAYFNDNQRSATKLAAKLAGLSVARLINEPSAAALCYHTEELGQEKKYLVIDFGGGTLDVSVVDCFENIIEIIAIAGDNRLGGDDIDAAIVSSFLQTNGFTAKQLSAQEQAILLQKAKQAKVQLSGSKEMSLRCQLQGNYYSMSITPESMREICAPLFQRIKSTISRALKESKVPPAELSDILLVGGSAKFTTFVEYIQNLFGVTPIVAKNTDEIVAYGACLCASIKERALRDIVMTDVCPFSLGVATYHSQQDTNPHMAVLIPRSSLLPISHRSCFFTLTNNQRQILCQIYQGENYYVRDNLKIGELTVDVPPGPAGKHFVTITFTYDIDGILHVEAESSGGQIITTVILNSNLSLSDAEIKAKTKALEALRHEADGTEEDKLILARLERLFAEFLDEQRDYVRYLIASFSQVLESGDRIKLKKERKRIQKETLLLEQALYLDPFQAVPLSDQIGSQADKILRKKQHTHDNDID